MKCFLDQIHDDAVGVSDAKECYVAVRCHACGGRIGTVYIIKGKPALKLNQGQVRQIYIK